MWKLYLMVIITVILFSVLLKHEVLFFRVTLEDLYNGKTSKLQLAKQVICSKCHGLVYLLLIYQNRYFIVLNPVGGYVRRVFHLSLRFITFGGR